MTGEEVETFLGFNPGALLTLSGGSILQERSTLQGVRLLSQKWVDFFSVRTVTCK